MHRLHVRIASSFVVAASLAGAIVGACSSNSTPASSTPCKTTECGTKLDVPTTKCADGSTAGPTGQCLKAPSGTCGWEVKTCGGGCSAAATKCPDGSSKTGTCEVDPAGACICTNPCDCSVAECGRNPYTQQTCADGTVGGSTCTRGGDGVCAWKLAPPCKGDASPDADATDAKPPPVDTSIDANDGGDCVLTFGTCPTGCASINAYTVDKVKKCWSGTKVVGCKRPGDAGDAAVVYYCGVDTGTTEILALPDAPASAFSSLRDCNSGEKGVYDAAAYTTCAGADAGTDTRTGVDTAPDAPYGDATACDFKTNIEPFFASNCAVSGCHVGSTPTGNMSLATGFAYSNTVEVPSIEITTLERVRRFDPDDSYLYMKITGKQAAGTSLMPPPSTGTTLTDAQKAAVRCWIAAGAPP